MTDNTQELDEILFKLRTTRDVELNDNRWGQEFVYTLNEAKQAILDWHNNQIETELEALREEAKHEDLRTISQIITARIDKLKESSND